MGIEPTWPAWEAGALPLSYTRKSASTDYQTWDIVSFLFCIVKHFPAEWSKSAILYGCIRLTDDQLRGGKQCFQLAVADGGR